MTDLPNTTVDGTGAQPAPVEIAKVAAEFTKVFDKIMSADSERGDARDVLAAASETSTNTRLAALVSLAGGAIAGNWSAYDVEQALDKSLSRRNAVDASIKTFASEIKRACHTKARNHVAAYVALASDAWKDEGDNVKADKKAPTPCRKAFARQYHLVQRMLGEAVDGGRVFASVADICDYAAANDPDLDYGKVFKRLRAIRAQIAGFAQDFPVPGFADVIEYIDAIEKDDLKTSREAPATVAPVSDAPVSDAPTIEPAAGISSLVDDALADMAA